MRLVEQEHRAGCVHVEGGGTDRTLVPSLFETDVEWAVAPVGRCDSSASRMRIAEFVRPEIDVDRTDQLAHAVRCRVACRRDDDAACRVCRLDHRVVLEAVGARCEGFRDGSPELTESVRAVLLERKLAKRTAIALTGEYRADRLAGLLRILDPGQSAMHVERKRDWLAGERQERREVRRLDHRSRRSRRTLCDRAGADHHSRGPGDAADEKTCDDGQPRDAMVVESSHTSSSVGYRDNGSEHEGGPIAPPRSRHAPVTCLC
jgi:hypothetical protein